MFANLHTHTEMSNISTGLDSINRLKDVVNKAKELGYSGLAITEHDCLSGVIHINRLQKQLIKDNDPFKIAIGNEIYLVDEYDPNNNIREYYPHFILIAKDKIGYQAIVELSSRAWYRSSVKYGKRRIPTLKKDLYDIITPEVKGHIVGATACIGGEAARHILAQEYEKADEFISEMSKIFGMDDFYIELQPSQSIEQLKFNKESLERYSNNKFIITLDSHYQNKEDFPIFEAFLRSKNESREVKEFYDYARLMEIDEIYELMKDMGIDKDIVDKCFINTEKIIDQVEFYDLSQTQIIPKVPLNEIKLNIDASQYKDLENYPIIQWGINEQDYGTKYCITYCLNNLNKKGLWNKTYLDRLEEEIDTHKYQSEQLNSNFFNYANMCQWINNIAWSIDCAVGPGRGSAGGCLLNYLMGITNIDPIPYDLKFWRYLNKVRTSPLDIDTDYQPSKKAELYNTIRAHRGELGLMQVATYRTLTLKSAINTAARGYKSIDYPNGLDNDISLYLSSLIEVNRGAVATLEQTLNGDEELGYKINKSFIKECNQFPGLIDIISKIEKLIVGSSTHASAILFFDETDKLTNHCGLMRAPNGDLCSALDLHTIEEAGCYKVDMLWLSTLDTISTCFKLLQKDNVVDNRLTLKECYDKYIDINKINYDDPQIWQHLYDGDILSIFQFDQASGRKGVLAANPTSLMEMTCINALIRLQSTPNEENQIERFNRIKIDPDSFNVEMDENNVSPERQKILHEETDKFNGCAASQECFMTLVQRLLDFSLKEADALRKTVAKKKTSEIAAQKDLFFEKAKLKGCDDKEVEYLWRVCIVPSLRYSFNLAHGTVYSMLGVQCILMGGILFPPIYWQTACLLQRSGALDSKSADYNKIAKAVCALLTQEVNIVPLDINKSERIFSMNAETNTIYFGFLGVKGLKEKVINDTLEMRPFLSMYDFMDRVRPDVTSMVALIKSGAFDEFGSREDNIMEFIAMKADVKSKLNGQNLLMISREGYWPEALVESQKVFNFTQYLKKISKDLEDKENYILDERAKTFLDSIDYPYGGDYLEKAEWKLYYDQQMIGIKNYLIENQEEMLFKVNEKAYDDFRAKYFGKGNISFFEIETMGVCFGEHPMVNVDTVDDFTMLPTEPILERMFTTKTGRTVPMYELTMIAGIAVGKDKQHCTVTILTANGPVDVKLRKQEFASYDSQISKIINGKKKVIERSWLNRGNMLLCHGMRVDDQFIGKYYKNSPMQHCIYKINEIKEDGKFEVIKNRPTGNEEEDIDII